PHGAPLRRAKGRGRLAQASGHESEHDVGSADDDRQHHHAHRDRGSQARPWEAEDEDEHRKMNRPATIDGSAVIASTTVRTGPARRLRVSLMKTAHKRPSGTVNRLASEMITRDPTMACLIPPFDNGSSGPVSLMSCR